MSIHDIRSLMDEGKNDQALIMIEMSEENELDLMLFKSMILRTQEFHIAALSEAKDALNASRNAKSKIHEAGALTQIAYLTLLSDKEVAEEHILKFDKIWASLTEREKKEAIEWEGAYYHVKGSLTAIQGDLVKSQELNFSALAIREKIPYKKELTYTLNNIAYNFTTQGDYAKGQEFSERQLAIARQLGNEPAIAWGLQRKAEIHLLKGEYDLAKEDLNKQLEIANKYNLAFSAKVANGHLSNIHYLEGNYEDALIGLTKENTFDRERGNKVYYAEGLYKMMKIAFKMESEKLAKGYYKRLEQFSIANNDNIIQMYYKISTALLHKMNKRSKDRAKAQILFEEILSEKYISSDIMLEIEVRLHLSDLLLDELKLYGPGQVLKEVNDLVGSIYEIAQEHSIYPIIIKILILRARIAFLSLEVEEATKIIQQAKLIAEERSLDSFLNMVIEEEGKLENEIRIATEISRRSSTVVDKMDKEKLVEYIKNMQDMIQTANV